MKVVTSLKFLLLCIMIPLVSVMVIPPHSVQAASGEIGFDCLAPRFGDTNCGSVFTLHPNNEVEVCLDASGNNSGATFRVKSVATGAVLGEKGVEVGKCTGTIYENATGVAEAVFITIDSFSVLRVQFQGRFVIS